MTTDNVINIIDASKEVEARPPEFSDDALALRFAERHRDDLRYVAAWKQWMAWTGSGTYWRRDTTLSAYDLARKVCREAAVGCKKTNVARAVASDKTVHAVINLARADRRIAATVEQWDADPWMLNTPGGVVDLRTGESRPARPDDYMTKITAVAPDRARLHPVWDVFLAKIMPDELARYLRRAFGYALTGSTREQVLFFLYGLGANGKTKFIKAVTGAMGDYHVTAPIETFMATKNPQHPTELARLQGARLVTAVETEQGRRWAQSRINMVTGGDKIAARFMRQDFFEYVPQFKLTIYGNYKPVLRSINEAVRRRMNLVPFAVTIPKVEQDLDLGEKLKAEWPGILSWLIDGCIEWQRDGLRPPEVVTEATKRYLMAEDVIEAWLEERCQRDPNYSCDRIKLFASWRAWSQQAEEETGSAKQFYGVLEERGFIPTKLRGVRCFKGLDVQPVKPEPDDIPY